MTLIRWPREGTTAIRDYALAYHALGFQALPIAMQTKLPPMKWEPLQVTQAPHTEIASWDWRGHGVGMVNGVNGMRSLDIDSIPELDGSDRLFVPKIIAHLLELLGLPIDYAWASLSGSRHGAQIFFQSYDIGIPSFKFYDPKEPGDFDHCELRWAKSITVLPPSRHASDQRYAFVHGWPDDAPASLSLPTVLHALETLCIQRSAKEPAKSMPRTRQTLHSHGNDSAYGMQALKGECDRVSHTSQGGRNIQLNSAAFLLGQLVSGGELSETTVAQALKQAAFSSGLPEEEIEATMRSGLAAGYAQPRSAQNDVLTAEVHQGNGHQPTPSVYKKSETIEDAIAAQDMKEVLARARELAERSPLEQARLKLSIMDTFPKFPMRQFEALIREERTDLDVQLQRRPAITNAAILINKEFEEIRPIVKDILLPGLIALAGKQKLGKSWLDYHLGIAVASGGMAFGSIPVEQGDVLYMALEDNDRRVQSRLKVCLSHMGDHAQAPERLDIVTEWPRMNAVGITALEDWIQSKENPRLIIIDPWVKVKPRMQQRAGETGYDTDYEALEGLKQLADKYQICILVQFHLRKADATDPFDELNGTTGITACADGFLSLKRPRGEKLGTLWGTGRDYEQEVNLAVSFEEALWTIVGDAETVTRGHASQEVLDILLQEQRPMWPKELATLLAKPEGAVRKRLYDMKTRGEVEDTRQGYIPASSKIGNARNTQQYEKASHAAPEPILSKLPMNISGNTQQYTMALEADGEAKSDMRYVTLDVTQAGNAESTPALEGPSSVTSESHVTLACNALKEGIGEPVGQEYIAERYVVTQNSTERFFETLSETCAYCERAIASYTPDGIPVCEEHAQNTSGDR